MENHHQREIDRKRQKLAALRKAREDRRVSLLGRTDASGATGSALAGIGSSLADGKSGAESEVCLYYE
jgi:2-methylisocitrate lyase-like PEP mutase family enzyme